MAHRRSLCDLVAWESGLYNVDLRAEEGPWLWWSGQEHLEASPHTLPFWEDSKLFPRWRLGEDNSQR